MKVLGMLSGTSHDGIDASVVEFTEKDGRLLGSVLTADSTPYSPALREQLRNALPPAHTTFAQMCELDTLIGQAFADAAAAAISRVGPIDLICSHGQTVFHWVDGNRALGTLQIGQPAWIAERTGVPVVSDVRIRDITAAGHGAPLVSFLDALLLAEQEGASGALNLGGIANMTVIRPGQAPYAYDIGAANALIDSVVVDKGLHELGFDADGAIASAGQINSTLLDVLLRDPFYSLPAPKSTGKEHFHGGYVCDAVHEAAVRLSETDLIATLTELTVQTVARDVRAAGIDLLVVSGGGCRNPVILDGLKHALPDVQLMLSDELGAPADDKEAIAFALIGWCTAHGLPATIASATGAESPRILGTITPGAHPLQLPEPRTTPPTALVLNAAALAR